MPQFKTCDVQEKSEIAKTAKILLVTATAVETFFLHKSLRPLPAFKRCFKMACGSQTYYIGRLGHVGVVHVQCQMGSVAAAASAVTVTEAIDEWGVAAVIMVGIAFGIDKMRQRIGDILISKEVILYEIQRVGNRLIQRGGGAPAGSILLNRFTNSHGWKFNLRRKQMASARAVQILSGEKLIDNLQFKKKLTSRFPEAGGGEMEGAGLFCAAHQKNCEWIIVKGICDFADGNKARGKKINQEIAAASAVSYCEHVLSQGECLEALGCPNVDKTDHCPKNRGSEEALFDIYEEHFEPFYLKRKVDSLLEECLGVGGLWLSGPSGSGKTSAIRRALIRKRKKYFFIDLSKCVGAPLGEIFDTLLCEFAEALGFSTSGSMDTIQHKDQTSRIKHIIKFIEKNAKDEMHFFIDEIPLDAKSGFEQFFDGIVAILIGLRNCNVRTVQFILSSIENAKPQLKPFQGKIAQQIQFIHMSEWKDVEIKELLTLIGPYMNLKFKPNDERDIVQTAAGCPRRLKGILKAILTQDRISDSTIQDVLSKYNFSN